MAKRSNAISFVMNEFSFVTITIVSITGIMVSVIFTLAFANETSVMTGSPKQSFANPKLVSF
jgi:hypothetical protein